MRPQHVVRIAAYCHLIETCELGDVPFGVLMFAGTYDCLIIPNTAAAQLQFEQALEETREFLQELEKGDSSPGSAVRQSLQRLSIREPRVYVAGQTDTMLGGSAFRRTACGQRDGRLLSQPLWRPFRVGAAARAIG